jgi:hypothetical protein
MTISEQLNLIAAVVGGNAWGLAQGKPRIYVPARKDMKVFFTFDDAAYASPSDEISSVVNLGSARLVILIDECGQHKNWYAGQKKTVIERNQKTAMAIMAVTYGDDEQFAAAIMDGDDLSDETIDAMAGHFVNGRIEEARLEFAGQMA